MASPKVSIIIPVHNTQQYIEQCLDSVVNQTLKEIEIICVDDGSTDNSLSILKSYSDKDKRIRVFHHDTAKSALGARKTGVLEATGEYIMFLDADDYYSIDACELVYNKIKEKKVEILNFNSIVVNCANLSNDKINSVQRFLNPHTEYLYDKEVFKGCFVNNLYKHNLWSKIYDAQLCYKAFEIIEDVYMPFAEDLYAYFIIANYAKSYYGWNSKPLYYYCYGRGISGGTGFTLKKHRQLCQHAEVHRLLTKFCEDKAVPDRQLILERYKNEWLNDCIGVWKGFLSKEDKPEGLHTMYEFWGVKDVVSLLTKRFWNSRTELAGYVGKLDILPIEKRKIKTIAFYYYSYSVGGVERVLSLLMPKFVEMGYKVILITDKDASENDFVLPVGVERYVIFDKDEVTGDNYPDRANSWEKIIKEHNIDMVLYSFWRSHLYLFDVMLLKGMDIPVIVQAHGVFSLAISEMHKNFSEHTKTFALSDGMVVLSAVDKLFWETYVNRVYKIPNPYSPDLVNVDSAKWSNKSIVWIGRVSPEKNPDAPFEIMKRVVVQEPTAKLYLIGDFNDSKWMEKAKKYGIANNVEFTGFVSNVNDYIKNASIHLMTSSFEGFPMALVEAKAHGMPTVMFNMPHLELGKKECGTIGVDMMDYNSAANEIVKLFKDEEYWNINSALAKNNAEILKNYDYKSAWSAVVKGEEPIRYHNKLTDDFVKTIVNHYDIGAKTVLSAKKNNNSRSIFELAISAIKCCKEKGFLYTVKLLFKKV